MFGLLQLKSLFLVKSYPILVNQLSVQEVLVYIHPISMLLGGEVSLEGNENNGIV